MIFPGYIWNSLWGLHGDDMNTVFRRLVVIFFHNLLLLYPPRLRPTCIGSSQEKMDINPVQREEFILNPAPPGLSTNQPAKDFLVWASLWSSQSHLPWYIAISNSTDSGVWWWCWWNKNMPVSHSKFILSCGKQQCWIIYHLLDWSYTLLRRRTCMLCALVGVSEYM